MKIEVINKYGCSVIVTADNVKIDEDVEKRIYQKKEDGTTDYLRFTRDIDTSFIDMFNNVLSDLLYYRKTDYDGSDLIKALFAKMPSSSTEGLINELKKTYGEN